MTLVEIAFRYGRAPGETELRALKDVREVYGIWRIWFEEANKVIRVEYDISRLSADDVAALLRNAGLDLVEKVALIPPTQPLAA